MDQADKELIVLVGMPGAGKTHYCETVLPNYERVSQDEGPGTFAGILRRLRKLMDEGQPRIVIDRTNPMRNQRKEFAALARAAGYRLKIVYFDTAEDVCRERIRNRKGHPTLAVDRMDMAIYRYDSSLNIPTAEECDELVVLDK